MPTLEELSDDDFTAWAHDRMEDIKIKRTGPLLHEGNLCMQYIAACNQEILRDHMVGTTTIPVDYVPVWTLPYKHGRRHEVLRVLEQKTRTPLLLPSGISAICAPGYSG